MTGSGIVTLDRTHIRRRTLLQAVALAAGRLDQAPGPLPPGTTARNTVRPSVAEARARGQLILVAEDDEVNQKVILQQLELLGYAADVAGDGREALRLWQSGDYALLLTDLHMPELDGYGLAGEIRRTEPAGVRHPLIALTAHALRGEEVRAREVGLDEMLTKPVPLDRLEALLSRWMRRDADAVTPPEAQATARAVPSSVVDISVLHALVGSDPSVTRDFLQHYGESLRQLGGEVDVALSAGAYDDLARVVHRLKSSSRSIGALLLGDRCAELEAAARARHATDTRAAYERFVHERARTEAAIDAMMEAP